MAVEKFLTYAVNETHHWEPSVLEQYGVEAVFGLYMFRQGERTHCCSTSPDSWCENVENVFICKGDDKDLMERAADDLSSDGLDDCYFAFIDPKSKDPRFIGSGLTVQIDGREHKDNDGKRGLRSESYHRAIWEAARDERCNGFGWPSILEPTVYRQYQAEQAVKRRAENRPVDDHRDPLPLFVR